MIELDNAKDKIREALKQSNLNRFTLVLDTYESQLKKLINSARVS